MAWVQHPLVGSDKAETVPQIVSESRQGMGKAGRRQRREVADQRRHDFNSCNAGQKQVMASPTRGEAADPRTTDLCDIALDEGAGVEKETGY